MLTWVKRVGLGMTGLIALLVTGYFLLAAIPRYEIDKSVAISFPSSPKSATEAYAFGRHPGFQYSEERAPCAAQYPTKKAFFGDLHIHTALSADAYPDGTRVFPEDAYRFAKGASIDLPIPDGGVRGQVQLTRPLDFAAITDHAETFGESYICRTKGAFAGYDSEACGNFRAGGELAVRQFMTQNARLYPKRMAEVCGADNKDCLAADKLVWQRVINAAEAADDKSAACSFSAFVGYEYTRANNAMHWHRNTIFKNAAVPDYPANYFSHPTTHGLLQSFERQCRLGIEACDVLSIPHNSNISGGNAFNPRQYEGFDADAQRALAALRASYDRLVEISQHKGISECVNGVSDILGGTDELCEVEQIRAFGKAERAIEFNNYAMSIRNVETEECDDDHFRAMDNMYHGFCLSSRDYARGALLEGLKQGRDKSINPFAFGFIGSSDTHIGAAGDTDEADWQGHIAYETDLAGRLGDAALGRFNRRVSNPGGLAGIYATENSRDALFHGMKRREAFATSGPRIAPRFFAGHFDADLCEQENWLATAYKKGVPMGARLAPQNRGFQFVLQAKRDAQSVSLDKLQLVKGWVDATGQKHNQVIDIAVAKEGADALCAVYQDVDYDPALPHYYYLRVVEQPSPRWSALQCAALPEQERPTLCDNDMPQTIREMAWSSPIWLTPLGQDAVLPAHDQPAIAPVNR